MSPFVTPIAFTACVGKSDALKGFLQSQIFSGSANIVNDIGSHLTRSNSEWEGEPPGHILWFGWSLILPEAYAIHHLQFAHYLFSLRPSPKRGDATNEVVSGFIPDGSLQERVKAYPNFVVGFHPPIISLTIKCDRFSTEPNLRNRYPCFMVGVNNQFQLQLKVRG